MEELIPILIWGILIFLFSSGGAKQKKKRQQMARQALIEARRKRMAQDAAAGGLVGVENEEEPVDDRARERAWGTREPEQGSPPPPSAAPGPPGPGAAARGEPQVPRNVWELVEALARGTLPTQGEPPDDQPGPLAADTSAELAHERPGRSLPPPAAEAAPRAERPPPTRRSIQARGQARSDAGITAVDALEHAAGADPTLTEVDASHHSKVADAVARARARRNAGKSREKHPLFGTTGRKGVRRAIVLSEVLGQPTALRDGLDPHRPPE